MPDREIRTLLLVDGSASVLFYHSMLLRRLEYKVMTSQSGEDALRLMEATTPAVIVTEIALPKMSGVHFLKALKESARFKNIPVVVLTRENDPAMANACKHMGCAAYLSKPVEPDVLYRALQSASESAPRANIRLKTSLKVIVGDDSTAGGVKRTEFATAISEGGLFIRTGYPQPAHALTPLRIFFDDREVRATAVVLYRYAPEEGPDKEPGMGMKFVEISDTDRAYIRKFIKSQITKDIQTP